VTSQTSTVIVSGEENKRQQQHELWYVCLCVVFHNCTCVVLVSHPISLDSTTLTLTAERQSARMSKITNDCLIQSGTGCFIAVHIWQQWVSKC